MNNRNSDLELGDLVEAVWTRPSGSEPQMIGIVISKIGTTMGLKVKVSWNEIGIRTEWISDIKRIN